MPEERNYARDINLQAIVQALKDHFMPQGYQTQVVGTSPHLIFQMAKTGTLESITGTSRAMTIQFRQKSDETTISLGEQKWLDKAAVGTIGAIILWPLFFTAAYGALKQSALPAEIWQVIDSVAYSPSSMQQPMTTPMAPTPFSRAATNVPPPSQMAGAMDQPMQGPKFCPDCGTKNTGAKFCQNCGKQQY